MRLPVGRALTCIALAVALFPGCKDDDLDPGICFESQVLPVTVSYCSTTGCHNPTDKANGYDFTTYDGVLAGVKPKRPGGSDIFKALTAKGDGHMPPEGAPQPSQTQIDRIEQWIDEGAIHDDQCDGSTCNTSASVTYAGDIQPMLSAHCIGCHSGNSPAGDLDFRDFETVQANALSGLIPSVMRAESGFTAMPPNRSSLPPCYPDMVDTWIAAGAPEN